MMKNSGFLTRAISGVVLVIILLIAGILGGNVLFLLTVFISLVGINELYKVLGIVNRNQQDKKNNMLAYTGICCSVVYFLMLLFFVDNYVNLLSYFIIVLIAVMMAVYVFTFPRFNVEQVFYAIVGVIYVPVFLSFVYTVRCLNGGEILIWLIFISSWICDTCAYLVGCSIGKHKLAPILSPKKSIEGAIGGVLGSMLVAFLFGYFVEYKILGGVDNSIRYVIICGVGAIVSQIGDLAASGIKRNKDIKDYGTLIPGHGGVMDRFDSVIFSAPFIYLMAQLLM